MINVNPTLKDLNLKNPEYPHIIKNVNQLSVINNADYRGFINSVSFQTPFNNSRYSQIPEGPGESILITIPRQQYTSYKQRIDEDLRLIVPPPIDFNPKHKMPVREVKNFYAYLNYTDYTNTCKNNIELFNNIMNSRTNLTL